MKSTLISQRIGDCCLVGDGAHASIKRKLAGVPYLTSKNLKDGRLELTKVDFIDEEDFSKHFRANSKAVTLPQTDDVVFGIIGSIGEPHLVRSTDRFGISSSVAIMRPNRQLIHPPYLYYWVKGPIFQDALYSIKGGVAQSYISLEMIRSLPLRYPSLRLQERIACILSAYDDLIENNTRRIKSLEQMAQALYREWFVHFRFPGHEKLELEKSSIGTIPRGWEVKKLGDVIELAYGKALKHEERAGGSVPVFGSSGIIGFHDKPLANGPGIIVGRKGNVGSVFWTDDDFYAIDTVFFVRTKLSLLYVFYNLRHQNFINNDAAVPGLSRGAAYLKPVIVPDDQTLTSFEEIGATIFEQLRVLREKNANLRHTRDLLLPKLISGEISVHTS